MKKLILIMLAIVSPFLAAAEIKKGKTKEELFKNKTLFEQKRADLKSKPQQVKSYEWNEITSSWDVVKYTEFQYNHNSDVLFEYSTDSTGKMLERIDYFYNDQLFKGYLSQVWVDSAWQNNMMLTIEYNQQNEAIKEEAKIWYNDQWEIFFGYSTNQTFDPIASVETVIDSMYDGTTYTAVQKFERFINTTTQLVDSEIMYFPMSSSDLEAYYKLKYSYFPTGLYSDIYQQVWNGTEWVNEFAQTQYLWDTEGRLTSFVQMEWVNGTWELRSKVVNDYLSNKSVIINTYAINMGILTNMNRSTYLNDDQFNQVESKFEQWDEANATWQIVMYNKYLLTYDSRGLMTEKITQSIDMMGNLINSWKEEYFNFTSSGITKNGFINMNVYPNPCTDYVKIDLPDLTSDADVSISIRNIAGQVISTQEFKSNTIRIDLDSYLSGLYVLEIKTAKGTESRKVVIQ